MVSRFYDYSSLLIPDLNSAGVIPIGQLSNLSYLDYNADNNPVEWEGQNMLGQKVITIHISKAQEGKYFTIPLDMPECVACFKLTYRYERIRETAAAADWIRIEKRNQIDLGLLAPDGSDVGFSGTEKDTVEISATRATPGYRPVDPVAGPWEILVGAYHIAEEGVDVTYTLDFTEKQRALYKGDLHTHTLASDGILTAEELCLHARRHGLDFLAITDHNTIHPAGTLPDLDGLTMIPGLEWTHYQGHAGLIGVDRPFEKSFHVKTADDVYDRFVEARSRGALAILNHPCDPDYGFHFSQADLPHDLVEVWNGPMRESNMQAIAQWHQRLVQGEKIPASCGSDYHHDMLFMFIGGPCLAVYAYSKGLSDLLEAIRGGHSYMVFGSDGPTLKMTAGSGIIGDSVSWSENRELTLKAGNLIAGDKILLINAQGVFASWTAEGNSRLETVVPIDRPGFVRVEIHRFFIPRYPAFPALVSNPIYFDA